MNNINSSNMQFRNYCMDQIRSAVFLTVGGLNAAMEPAFVMIEKKKSHQKKTGQN